MTRQRNPVILLEDIEQAAEEIAGFIKGVECEAFVLNVEKRRAVERNFGIIGEAMNQLHHADPQMSGHIKHLRRILVMDGTYEIFSTDTRFMAGVGCGEVHVPGC